MTGILPVILSWLRKKSRTKILTDSPPIRGPVPPEIPRHLLGGTGILPVIFSSYQEMPLTLPSPRGRGDCKAALNSSLPSGAQAPLSPLCKGGLGGFSVGAGLVPALKGNREVAPTISIESPPLEKGDFDSSLSLSEELWFCGADFPSAKSPSPSGRGLG